MDGFGASSYGDAFADVYDERFADVSDAEGTVATVGSLAPSGRVLELGAGTGRLAIPLAAAGHHVVALDSSRHMLERLAAKPRTGELTAVLGDMTDLVTVADLGPFDLVLIAFNTLFNLPSETLQQRCLHQVRAVLADTGHLVVEAWAPRIDDATQSDAVEVRELTADRVVLRVSRLDRDGQTIAGQDIDLSEAGVHLRPWLLRYLTTAELDRLAATAGLALESRHGDWRGAPFDRDSTLHVSVYGPARARESVVRAR